MIFHNWDDQDFDWKSLYDAIEEGTHIMEKFGRIGVHSKEKYGTARWHLYLFTGHLHELTHPGYVYCRYPKWLWRFDVNYRPLRFLIHPIRWWQKKVIEYAFNYMCNRYPHISAEIVVNGPESLLPDHLKIIYDDKWIKL
jgi:hypothetical protein